MEYTSGNIRMWSRLGASGAFGAAALELGEERENMVLLSADMAYASGLERFKAKYPGRHYSVGIAEQNLVGMAAGMASESFIPYATTYATFFAMRAMDQIKMCLGYMRQNVKLVGLLSGFGAGILGPTHMAVEDLAVMRAIPNITILSPADGMETVKALLAAADINGPVYIRMPGGLNLPIVYKEDYAFSPGRAICLKKGEDVSIFATGTMVYFALQAATLLEQESISAAIYNMHTIKPLDLAAIDEAAKNTKLLISVEEHSVLGGLGGAIAEHLSAKKNMPLLLRLGVKDEYPHAGNYESLLAACGLTAEGIKNKISKTYEELYA